MAEQFYTILTNTGKAKIANSVTLGTKINLTTLKVGDSNGAYYNPTETQTNLVHSVYQCNITSVAVDETNSNWINITCAIPSDVGDFYIREAGVFDDGGNLIAIGKYPETYKPVAADGTTKELYIKMTFEVSNSSSVTLKIDPTVILATKSDINTLTTSMNNSIDSINTSLSDNMQNITVLETNKASKSNLNLSIKNNTGLAYDTFTFNNGSYNHFGLMHRLNSGCLFMLYRDAPSHIGSSGGITSRKSYDGGKTWVEYTQVIQKKDNIDIGGIGGLVTTSGRIILIYVSRNLGTGTSDSPMISQGMFSIYSDDEGVTWSDAIQLPIPNEARYLIYGRAIQLSDRIIQSYYAYTETGTRVSTLISTDNGLTWINGANIYNGNENVTECALSNIGNVIIGIIRNENKTLKQIRSIDAGITYTVVGDITFNGEYPVSPFTKVIQNSNGREFLLLMYEDRVNKANNTTTLKLRYADFQNLQSSSSIWSDAKNLLDTIDANNGASGYPSFTNDGYKIRYLVFDEINSALTNIINKTYILGDIPDYDSGWISISNATTININHGFGVIPRKVLCLFSKTTTYSPCFNVDNILKASDTGIFYRTDLNYIYVSTGTSFCYAGFEGSTPPSLVQSATGYVRILAWL